MLVRIWRHRNPYTLLVGMQNGAAAMETVRYMIARGLGQGEMGIICLMTTECPLG